MEIMICTTGTSIAQGIRWQGCESAYRDAIRARVDAESSAHEDWLRRISGETNSISRYGPARLKRAVLLHTETDDGRICAEEIGRLIETHLNITVSVNVITGLNVQNGELFRRAGIQNLVQAVRRIHDKGEPVVLNATAGFKAVVPYLTLYGLLYRLPVVYVFERSDALIVLPPAPVSFDYERLLRARPALLELAREGVISREAFFSRIAGLEYAERDWFESLIEDDGEMVTASAFGFLVLPTVASPNAQVFVSTKALKALQKADGVAHGQFVHMLNRMGDPLWRQVKIHAMPGELKVFKPGNTDERVGAIVRGENVYVAELWQHHAHEDEAAACKESDYDLKTFVPWNTYSRQHEIADVPERPLQAEIDTLKAQNKEMRIELRALHKKQGEAAARERATMAQRKTAIARKRQKAKKSDPAPKAGPMAAQLAALREKSDSPRE